MVKRTIAALLLCICFCIIPFYAEAASTTDAQGPILTDTNCSLTITYKVGETVFSNLDVKLYKVATVSADFQYSLTSKFGATNLVLNGIKTQGEWNTVRSTLESYIIANGITPDAIQKTNTNGVVDFEALTTGLYLAVTETAVQGDKTCLFTSALVSVPSLAAENLWQYDVSVNAKGEILPPIEPDDTKELKVTKVWKGDSGKNTRPKNVKVEIFRNGKSYKTVTLSPSNNWSYSWSAKDDGAKWTVTERNVPKGYVMTVSDRETTFVITNTYGKPDRPGTPQTGDSSNVLLYIIIMNVSGLGLIIIGIAGKRKRNEK